MQDLPPPAAEGTIASSPEEDSHPEPASPMSATETYYDRRQSIDVTVRPAPIRQKGTAFTRRGATLPGSDPTCLPPITACRTGRTLVLCFDGTGQ
jgi:hypothetical protein